MPILRTFVRASALLFTLVSLSTGLQGADTNVVQTGSVLELKKLPLEDLLNQEVTLVSRRPEPLFATPSAVQVVTGEDILRSGALTLPEALRLAPNLQVAQQNGHDWAISARGFTGAPFGGYSLADKLLVMIDGRSVYTPLFGGVFWDVQNVLLENVDRIEVVSGPGASLWGDNAVNGVINVVSKSARDTQGLYLSGATGSLWQDYGAVQYGGNAGTNLFYRVYGERFDHRSGELADGSNAQDAWDMSQGGFRMDYYRSEDTLLTWQGDFYSGGEGVPSSSTVVDGQNVLGRWTRTFSEDSDLRVQAYWDRTWRHVLAPAFADELNTFDLDAQHRFGIGERQMLTWGGEYRLMRDSVWNSPALSFRPSERDLQLLSGFVQDEIELWPDRLKLTLGTKLEHNDYSGFELQPSARLAWTPSYRQTVWTAISRAVRSPSRLDQDEVVPQLATPPGSFEAEKVVAYELGYRVRPVDRFSLSLATFFNQYHELRSIDYNPTPPPVLILANGQEANTWGLEGSAEFQAADWWRIRGGYTYLGQNIWATTGNVIPGSDTFEANDPRHQWLLQSMIDLPCHWQLDAVGRYVSSRPGAANFTPAIPDYETFDLRLAWKWKQWEFSIVGQNLGGPQHLEVSTYEVPRSVYGKVTCRF